MMKLRLSLSFFAIMNCYKYYIYMKVEELEVKKLCFIF